MLGVFRGMLRGARRIPMTSKRGKKSFYKGKVDIMSACSTVVLQAIPFAEERKGLVTLQLPQRNAIIDHCS